MALHMGNSIYRWWNNSSYRWIRPFIGIKTTCTNLLAPAFSLLSVRPEDAPPPIARWLDLFPWMSYVCCIEETVMWFMPQKTSIDMQ